MSVKQDKVKLVCKRSDGKGSVAFAKLINEYIKQGYSLSESNQIGEAAIFGGMIPHLTMVKDIEVEAAPAVDESVVVEPEVVVEESREEVVPELVVTESSVAELSVDLTSELDSLTKKADLLEFAKKNNIEVPEDLKFPAQISKFLKERLSQE